tara:strand:- start:2077 stop:2334 length:258 start_codon:yes stop_codon:yes gene_type:complete
MNPPSDDASSARRVRRRDGDSMRRDCDCERASDAVLVAESEAVALPFPPVRRAWRRKSFASSISFRRSITTASSSGIANGDSFRS